MDMDLADYWLACQERRPSRRLDDDSLIADESMDESQDDDREVHHGEA